MLPLRPQIFRYPSDSPLSKQSNLPPAVRKKHLFRRLMVGMVCLLGGLLFIFSTGCQRTYRLTVLGTNDHHGHYWRNPHGEYGLAARRTIIDAIRSEVQKNGGQVLLLSAGDINTGPPESTLLQARPDILGMNLLEYDAMAIGNHEFDQPLAVLKKQEKWANFPFLSANIRHRRNGKNAFTPYISKNLDGLTVTIIGFTTPDTPRQARHQNTAELIFQDPVQVAGHLLPKLKKKSDIIIGLSHLGYYPGGRHGNNAPGDVTLARNTDGIAYIVGGHTHVPLAQAHLVGNTLISQAGEWGKYISRADFLIEKGRITLQKYRLIPINLLSPQNVSNPEKSEAAVKIPEDPMMITLLTPYRLQALERLSRPVGRIDARFEGARKHIRNRETSLGNLLADAMRRITGSDLAIINSGAIRDSLEPEKITLRQILTVHPFDNTICTAELTGSSLKDYLTEVFNQPPGNGGFPQTYGVAADLQQGIIKRLCIQNQAVVDNRLYKIAVNSFIAQGGDGYPLLTAYSSFLDTQLSVSQALLALFSDKPVVSRHTYRPQNRIRHLSAFGE